MALELENINNLIADDLDLRNRNWTTIDDSLELKADKTEVDDSLELKADKTYVDSQDLKQMPIAGGTFTGISKAHPNTSHTVAQIRNVILSTSDANESSMGEGDIWIKYS